MIRRVVAVLVATCAANLLISSPASAGTVDAPIDPPSCASHVSPGPDGTVTVHAQINLRGVDWAVVMEPPAASVGRWDIDAYLSGKKTTSGFHRTTTGIYTPHGVVPNPKSGLLFSVQGQVSDGFLTTYVVNSTPCRIP